MKQRVNWAQAFAEVGLLALGAVIALGVDSWSDARRERAEADAYLSALAEDFTENLARLDDLRATYDVIRADGLRLLAGASPSGGASEEQLTDLMQGAFMLADFEPITGTYDDMVNSGDLRLIPSNELRIGLAGFVSRVETLDATVAVLEERWHSLEEPFFLEHLSTPDIVRRWPEFDAVRSEVSDFSHDPGALRSRYFANLVQFRLVMIDDVLHQIDDTKDVTAEILRLIRHARGASN